MGHGAYFEMNSSHVAAIVVAGMLLAIPFMTPAAFSEDKTAIATIEQPTCGLDLGAGSLDFGSLLPDQVSPPDLDPNPPALSLTLTNTGTADTGSVGISGSEWDNADPDITEMIMLPSATHWSVTDFQMYPSMNAINDVTLIPGNITPGGTLPVYFRLQAALVAGQEDFAGGVTQTLTFVASC